MSDLEKIVAVVRKHHLMTLATVGASGSPWVAHVFYAWAPELQSFVFTTDPATRHGTEILAGMSTTPPYENSALARLAAARSRVAAGIALETRIVGRVQGIQIEGDARYLSGDGSASARLAAARSRYLKRFPYAAAMDLKLWLLAPTTMKLTDNTLGFGTKIQWQVEN